MTCIQKNPRRGAVRYGIPLMAVLATIVGACTAPLGNVDRYQMCSTEVRMPCLSGQVCSVDEARGCQICRCAPPSFTPIDRQGPPGTPSVTKV